MHACLNSSLLYNVNVNMHVIVNVNILNHPSTLTSSLEMMTNINKILFPQHRAHSSLRPDRNYTFSLPRE